MNVNYLDPVHFYEGEWWFWNETWSDVIGPYPTEKVARETMKLYAEQL